MNIDLMMLLSVCVLGAMSPGPSLMVILGVAAREGPRAAALASWAHACGVGLWAALSLSGWSYTLSALPTIARLISACASAYLIYLAYQLMREALARGPRAGSSLAEPSSESPSEFRGARNAIMAGFLISISNPKLLIFFTSIYPQVIPHQEVSGATLWIALLTPLLIDGAWYHLVSALSSRSGLLSALERHQRLIATLTALLFVGVALKGLCS